MRVYFERSGGFAGMTMKLEINSESLSQEDAEKLRQKIDKIDFSQIRGHSPLTARGADRFQYTIKIDKDDGSVHKLTFTDDNIPDSIQPLVDHLQREARKRRG